ncbi:MAG: sarcosine oxidase subunit gamma family protein [Burkholderiaceae bacterium]
MSTPRYRVTVCRRPQCARFEVRGERDEIAAALLAAGAPVPQQKNRSSENAADLRVDWLGPRRFVVSAPLEVEQVLGATLRAAFEALPSADVVCTSDMVVTFELAGAGAGEVLCQGTPIDISLAAFAPGSVTTSDLWGIGAVIERPVDAPNSLRVTVDRALAGYVEAWLMEAAGMASELKPGVMATSGLRA